MACRNVFGASLEPVLDVRGAATHASSTVPHDPACRDKETRGLTNDLAMARILIRPALEADGWEGERECHRSLLTPDYVSLFSSDFDVELG